MSATLLLVQALNGLQLGILLFLLAAGLTLVFGIMNFINLAHGSLYMMGAFIAATVFRHSGSFLLAAAAVVAGMALLGLVLDRVAGAALSARAPGPGAGHLRLHPVLQRADAHHLGSGAHQHGAAVLAVRHHRPARRDLSAVPLPHHRGGTGGGCYALIHRTRLGMLIRAGSTDRMMVGALGVNIARLNTLLFVLGAVLAGVAGLMAARSCRRMGEPILILTLVVIVIGGIGSVRGAFLAALMVAWSTRWAARCCRPCCARRCRRRRPTRPGDRLDADLCRHGAGAGAAAAGPVPRAARIGDLGMLRFSPRALAAGSLLLVLALVPLCAMAGRTLRWRCSAGCWCTASPRWP